MNHHHQDFLQTFWIALILTIPIFFYSDMATMIGVHGPRFPFWQFAVLALGTIIYIYCGRVFLIGAWHELHHKLPGMMTLIALAITTSYVYSVFAIVSGRGHDLLFELASLITIMLIGHFIEMKSASGARGALKEIAKLMPDTAEVARNDATEIVPIENLQIGDIVIVKPGGNIPADGMVIDGASDVNESIITGESQPVAKSAGSHVIAGSINGDGSLRIEVAMIGEQTFLAGVMRLVAQAQASKSRLQILSDRAAFYLTIIAVVGGAITFVAWLIAADALTAVERTVAVLVITCPHALGLAVPLVAAISTGMAARSGLLVKNRLALEEARHINAVLFDKTGTLTQAQFRVVSATYDETLVLAASINMHSEHPIARAMVDEAQKRNLVLKNVNDFERVPGRGVRGTIESSSIFVGTKGGDDIVVEKDGAPIGIIEVADTVRPESKSAIKALQKAGIRTIMITGDSERTARNVAQELGLDEYFARVLPKDKVEKVYELQSRGFKVAMVGDGVNDAPALAAADLGIAVGAGTNVAIESAGIILVKNDPRDIPNIIRLSKLTYTKMVQNLIWATGYNVVAIPLATGVFAHRGIALDPAVAAVLMSTSTVIVALNALTLKRKLSRS